VGAGGGQRAGHAFAGRDTVLRRRDDVRRRATCLTFDEMVLGKEPVFADGRPVGHVTSAAYGYTIGRGIAYVWLPVELASRGAAGRDRLVHRRIPTAVAEEPLFDPA
jgi:dimethylglycine oxidase